MDVQKLVAILEPLSNVAWWRVLVRQSTELAKLQNDALAWHGEAYKATRAGDCPDRWQEFANESDRHAEKYRSLTNEAWSIYWNAAREIRRQWPELLGALPIADGVTVDDIDPNEAARAIQGIIGRLLSTKTIPPEFRSKPIAKKLAATLLGKPNEDSGVKWLNACIDDGTIDCEPHSRQSFVFDIRQFPEAVHPRLLPPKSR